MIKKVGPDAAVAELPRKLKHENALKKKVKKLFNQMTKDVKNSISSDRNIPGLLSYDEKLNEILINSYQKTSKTFKNGLRKELNLGKLLSNEIDNSINDFIANNTIRQSKIIMNTTRAELELITNRIIENSALDGVFISPDELSVQVSREFKRRGQVRSKIIAQTETQIIAEKSKVLEAKVLTENDVIKAIKRWDAVLDRRTRTFHATSDGQRRGIDEPFDVNGEQLMNPGDTSLGASASNIVNCRCSVQFLDVK